MPGDSVSAPVRFAWTFLVLLLVAGPLAALCIEAVSWARTQQLSNIATMFHWERQLGLLARSVAFSGSVAAGGLVVGVLAATFFWTWNSKTSRMVSLAMLAMIAVPPYLHALAWRHAISGINLVAHNTAMPELAFGGWGAAWWVQTMALAPIAAGLALLGLHTVDRRLFEAARILRSDMDAFIRIVVPLAAPPVLAATGFVFLFTLVDYSVPSLFLLNTYALEIFAEFSANHVAARALLIALPFLVLTLLAVAIIQKLLRQAALGPPPSGGAWAFTPVWPKSFGTLQGLAVAILGLQVIVPLISLVDMAGRWDAIESAASSTADELFLSARTAAIAAVACLPLALFAANRTLGAQRGWWLLALLPLGIPGPLVGVGLITLWNNAFTTAIYDGEPMLVLTYLARFMPVAALILYAQLRRIDPLLIDAARILRPGAVRLWIQVYVPLLMRAGIAAMLLVFALSLGELTASLLTVPPGEATITMRVYGYMHYGASEKVAALCLVMPLMTIAFAAVISAMAGAWRFLLPGALRWER